MAIPMTRLGGHAFNHTPNQDVEAEYDRLRDLARQEGQKKGSCFGRSHQAYESGDGAAAKSLSDEGKRHASQQDAYNKQASELIFRENNGPDRVAGDTIDLHGQYVEEAEAILEARIADARARSQSHLHVIVGKGNHSAGHVQKIRPVVERTCRDMGLRYALEENEGRIYVDLTGKGEAIGHGGAPPPLTQQPGGRHSGYPGAQHAGGGSRPHHQQQQHHHQQQQQQQQQHHQQQGGDEVEKLAKKFLPKIVRELKACCVVM